MRRPNLLSAFLLPTLTLACSWAKANAQIQLPAEIQQEMDTVATDALGKTGAPSASVAVAKDAQVG
jgi:hypothetical protein